MNHEIRIPHRVRRRWKGDENRSRNLCLSLALVLLVLVSYWQVFSAGYIWDDEAYILENSNLKTNLGLLRTWTEYDSNPQYYPVLFSLLWVEFKLWATSPFGYHAVSIAIHSANCILIYFLLKRLQLKVAWFVAALFAVHPINVDSVAWAAEQKNLFAMFFGLLTCLQWDDFIYRKRNHNWLLALTFFSAALLSKTAICTLPLLLLLWAWFKRLKFPRATLFLRLAPFFLLAFLDGLANISIEKRLASKFNGEWNLPPDLNLIQHIILPFQCLAIYVSKILLPINLSPVYDRFAPVLNFKTITLVLCLAFASAVLWIFRNRISRGVVFGVIWFVVTLLPALGFSNGAYFQFSFVADHFTYFSVIGLITAISIIIENQLRKRNLSHVETILATVLIVWLGALTYYHTGVYHNQVTFWNRVEELSPNSDTAHTSLGTAFLYDGKLKEAESEFHRALQIRPGRVEALNNLALVHLKSGDTDSALPLLKKAVKLSPTYSEARWNLANIYADRGLINEAIENLLADIVIEPSSESFLQLGKQYIRLGNFVAASHFLRRSLAMKEENPVCHALLGGVLKKLHDPIHAAFHLRESLHEHPNQPDVANDYSWLLSTSKNVAVRNPKEALKIALSVANSFHTPNPSILDTLASAYAANGDFSKAVKVATEAERLAKETGNAALLQEVESHLKSFQNKQPLEL
jgi:Flp pilus assembly protein TadD